MSLCLLDLAQLTGGELRLAAMPPRDRDLALVRRIVLSPEAAREGDVFWCFDRRGCDAELAFLRGALAAAVAGPAIEPWPGRACLLLADPIAALAQLLNGISGGCQESLASSAELKVLQLCAARRVDIPPSTCGRSAKSYSAHRCRRQAA
jgi:hypothetical protein